MSKSGTVMSEGDTLDGAIPLPCPARDPSGLGGRGGPLLGSLRPAQTWRSVPGMPSASRSPRDDGPLVASLTDPIVQFAVDVVDAMGLAGIFLLMVAES